MPLPVVLQFDVVSDEMQAQLDGLGARTLSAKGADGLTVMHGVAVVITSITLKHLVSVIKDYLTYRKELVVKFSGIELRGYDASDAERIIKVIGNALRGAEDV